jgi:hypothetical protein
MFLLSKVSSPALWPTQPPIRRLAECLPSSINWPGRYTDHSTFSNAEVNNERNYTSTSSYAFMTCRGTALPLPVLKNRNSFAGNVWKFYTSLLEMYK